MATEYKVISEWLLFSPKHKAKNIENHLNSSSASGWEFVALDPVMLLGIDIGFYLVLGRPSPAETTG